MKKFFYFGLFGLALFEIANVYFIMPMPGSQRMTSIDLAYFLYTYRWAFRVTWIVLILIGTPDAFAVQRKWLPALAIIPVIAITYMFNFKMTADRMFLQPQRLDFASQSDNALTDSAIVVSVNIGGEAKAYPIRLIQYHHQVRDTVGGTPVMVTYCNVCRTGRVFRPIVNGEPENFRLVGMDHFNAMFEDSKTRSWWRQANGEAVTGALKGTVLPEIQSNQHTLRTFFKLYPDGKVMQPEAASKNRYDTLARFEKGRSRGELTRTDSLPWKDKSWVVGVEIGEEAIAYDWLLLREQRVIHDVVSGTPIVVAIASDDHGFVVFERRDDETFAVRNDSLISSFDKYDLAGRGADGSLKQVKAYQEFWHSWRTFHPGTATYKAD